MTQLSMIAVAHPIGMWVAAIATLEKSTACAVYLAQECRTQKLVMALAAFKSLPQDTQIKAVNDWANAQPYVSDQANYQTEDYWATLAEFAERGGDCEDYAIAKYSLLRALGYAASDMQIVMVYDQLRHAVHAVLSVFWQGHTLVLDNQSPQVMGGLQAPRYQALMAINEAGLWQIPQIQTVLATLQMDMSSLPAAGPSAGLSRGVKHDD